MMKNPPDDFRFVEYSTLWSYTASPAHKKNLQVDVFAQAGDDGYCLIGEVKNRKKKFTLTEAKAFFAKASEVKKLENISKTLLFVFSASGFYKTAIDFFVANSMAWSADKRFLE